MAKGFGGRMPGMGGGMNMNMLKQAQKMQQDMMKMQQELQEKEYQAAAGGGVVSATVNGKHELKNLVIDPEAVDPEDVEMLQDMIVAAVNEAMRSADADAAGTMSKLTGGLGLPFYQSFYNNSKTARPASRAWRFFRIDVKSPALETEPGLCVFSD